jgi:hypothetical protein
VDCWRYDERFQIERVRFGIVEGKDVTVRCLHLPIVQLLTTHLLTYHNISLLFESMSRKVGCTVENGATRFFLCGKQLAASRKLWYNKSNHSGDFWKKNGGKT